MPFYEYICKACGLSTELLQRVSDPPEHTCPHCGATRLVKQISAAGFRLKGGGWYETDFKSKDQRNLATTAAEGSAKVGDNAGSSSKSDSDKTKSSSSQDAKKAPKEKPVDRQIAKTNSDTSTGTSSST